MNDHERNGCSGFAFSDRSLQRVSEPCQLCYFETLWKATRISSCSRPASSITGSRLARIRSAAAQSYWSANGPAESLNPEFFLGADFAAGSFLAALSGAGSFGMAPGSAEPGRADLIATGFIIPDRIIRPISETCRMDLRSRTA